MEEMLKVVGLLGGLGLAALGIKVYGDKKKEQGFKETIELMSNVYGAEKLANDLMEYKKKEMAKANKG